MMATTLFMVTCRPVARHEGAYVAIYWFTHAASKAAAVRKAVELLPDSFGGASGIYAKPTAEIVAPGGPARRL